ncbi:hypothetical protein FOS39_09275 [Lactobacillus paracasei]|nr:hypothetical protein [Lacticaseibacillus paracasei]
MSSPPKYVRQPINLHISFLVAKIRLSRPRLFMLPFLTGLTRALQNMCVGLQSETHKLAIDIKKTEKKRV